MEQKSEQRWDLDSLYKGGVGSTQLSDLSGGLSEALHELDVKLQAYQADAKKRDFRRLVEMITQFQYILSGCNEVEEYSICLYAENVSEPNAQVQMEESAVMKAKLLSVQIDLDRVLAEIPQKTWDKWIKSKELRPSAFYLNERRLAAKDLLPVELEKMINSLSVNGIMAWEQQHELMLSNLKISIIIDGENIEASIGQALHEAVYSTNRESRQAAAAAIEKACAAEATAFAAILNRLAGFRLNMYGQRGWNNILKETVEQNRITEKSIQAMVTSIETNKTLYQAFFQRKIDLDRFEKVSWFEVESPRFSTGEKITYTDAKKLICRQFHLFSEKLGRFADRAFEEGWIETENRPNKAEGGFCASMPLSKESRIFLTYRENYQDIVTLAHELGHAYHNYILHDEPALAQQKGTSVAETASTFMENLVLDTVINQTANDSEKLALLEIKIRDGLKYLVTVPNMFRFEQQFYEKRKKGMLSASEIIDLLNTAENNFYGGMIDEPASYKWMYISHFYDAEKSFYNIPYTIGYLFSNGIYAQSQKEGNGFSERYDGLLRSSGKMTVEQLAESFLDTDLTKPDFWDAAQLSLKEAIHMYLQLTEKICNHAR